MSIFDRRPGLRWAVPAGAAALLVGGASLAPLAATASSGLEPRTAEELLAALAQPGATALSGTVTTTADLGLPDLPMGMRPNSGPMALASGGNTLRVWTDGPQRQRLALIERSAETTVVRNGQQAWVWSSAAATADRYDLPAHDAGLGAAPDGATLPPGVALPSTPQEAAEMALEAIDPSTEVTTSGVGSVAGRAVHELVLTPRDPETLVARVTLSIDAATNVPLRVRVDSTRIPGPAFAVGFSAVDFAVPDPALFEFTPPPGSTVTEHEAPAKREASQNGTRDDGAEPTVVGEGWSTVVIGELPPDSLADLAEAGTRGSSEGYGRGGDPAGTALALIEALPAESGPWGTGRVLRGTLFSAILTDDGRVAIGAVRPEALGAALAAR